MSKAMANAPTAPGPFFSSWGYIIVHNDARATVIHKDDTYESDHMHYIH
jgi:hypothetical protein